MEWWHLQWFNLAIPKHSFVGWIVILSKLSTKARILQRGLQVLADGLCVFCRSSIEFRDHLFFGSSFTRRV